jgi:nitric oxide reductase activation protein
MLHRLLFLKRPQPRAEVVRREPVRLVDIQRRLSLYLLALLGTDFAVRPASAAFSGTRTGHRPYIDNEIIFLPNVHDDEQHSGMEFYRAAALHCAAHLAHAHEPFEAKPLKPLQITLIGLLEDARVEALAIQRFPGLRALWGQFHRATPAQGKTASDYLNRLARALLDAEYLDPDPWITEARQLFAAAADKLDDSNIAVEIGLALAQSFASKRLRFRPRHSVLSAQYRDDNHSFWNFPATKTKWRLAVSYDTPDQVVQADSEVSGEVVQQVLDYSISPDPNLDEGGGDNLARKETVAIPFLYPEWDYRLRQEFAGWVTVFEKLSKHGNPKLIDEITTEHRYVILQMRHLLSAMQPQNIVRLRKLEDGDEIDLNAAQDSLLDMRAGLEPSLRIMMRNTRKSRDIAVLVLLDLSSSANNIVAGHEHTVLDLTRQATALLAEAIGQIGDPFAIHGFCSNGRHDVSYYRLKNFDQEFDDDAKASLSGATAQLSTRMGAAIRHATRYLKQQTSRRKLLLIVTDGEPADIDERDVKYLRYDTKRAVDRARNNGIIPYCISLDAGADRYVSHIFGQRNYMVVDHVARLPERLPLLYAAITR